MLPGNKISQPKSAKSFYNRYTNKSYSETWREVASSKFPVVSNWFFLFPSHVTSCILMVGTYLDGKIFLSYKSFQTNKLTNGTSTYLLHMQVIPFLLWYALLCVHMPIWYFIGAGTHKYSSEFGAATSFIFWMETLLLWHQKLHQWLHFVFF